MKQTTNTIFASAGDTMLRAPEVAARVGASHVNVLYRWIAQGKFPPPAHVGTRTSVWPASIVDRFIAARVAEIEARWQA